MRCFYGCENLKEVHFSEGLENIGGNAFQGCGIESIIFPSTVNLIGVKAFADCSKLTSVIISGNVKIIAGMAFYGCASLVEINIPENVEEIGDEAFTGCTSLTKLSIPNSVMRFHMNSICYTNITHFVFPKNIQYNPFYTPKHKDGMPLNYLVIQKGTGLLQYSQFHLYDNLDTFYFEGTEEEFAEIEIYKTEASEKWESNLKIYYYSETEPTQEGNFWHYVDGLPVKW